MVDFAKISENTLFLVTGGAGFIGANLSKAIIGRNCKVRVLDNMSTGKNKNMDSIRSSDLFEFIEGDIRNIEVCMNACKGVDYVLHEAALGSVPRSVADPLNTNDVNISGTLNMLVAARDNKVKRFIYASSSSVYGDDSNLLKIEDRRGNPLSPYSITKITDEYYANNFYRLYGLETIGLRYFNVYGPLQDSNSEYSAVIPLFIKRLLKKETPAIYGDGTQSRDFTYIDDVVQANLIACLASENCVAHVFNIAYGARISLIDLYNTICNLIGVNVEPLFAPSRAGDILHSNADISKAKSMLGYVPQIAVTEGLERSIEWFGNNL